jgi:aryl-alcohol dehydrogenase-like predicted oxidoreductase
MKSSPLGRSGLSIGQLGFGTWSFCSLHYGEVAESDAHAALDAFVAGGGNFIDTAAAYGQSEEVIGRWLQASGKRDQVVIASKCPKNDPATIRAKTEESLRKLQIDCLDLQFLHNPPDAVDEMNESLDVLEQLKAEGKIRAIGGSIKGGNVTDYTVELARQYINTGRIDAIMLIFSIFRQKLAAIFDEAKQAQVCLVGRTSLESGFLGGKYAPGHRFPGSFPQGDQRTRWPGDQLDAILAEAQELKQVLVKPPYQTLGQVALRFALDQDGLGNVVVGAKNAEQMQANLAVCELPPLPEAVHQMLAEHYAQREDLVNI